MIMNFLDQDLIKIDKKRKHKNIMKTIIAIRLMDK